jgi:ADP-ribose pyrophosphatase YjhB (NUDIX family)
MLASKCVCAPDDAEMRESLTFLSKIILSVLQFYWRATRGIALAVEACLIDAEHRVALIKVDAGDGWQLPRTAVRKGEGLDDALRRFLMDKHHIRIDPGPELFWLYAGAQGSNGQTGLYVVRQWQQDKPPAGAGLSFFGLSALPASLPSQDAARIRQAVEGRAPFEVC